MRVKTLEIISVICICKRLEYLYILNSYSRRQNLLLFYFRILFRMEFQSYTWFIYVLTFLLVMAILLIFILIAFKCFQTCAYTSIMCCKKRRRQTRRSRTSNNRHSESDNSSFNYSSSASESEASEHFNATQFGAHPERRNSNILSVLDLHLVHDNLAFASDCEYSTRNVKVINRKLDDPSRFRQKYKSNNLNTISNYIDQTYPILREKSTPEPKSNNNLTNTDLSAFSNFYGEDSIIDGTEFDEIPPAYDQVIRESTV